MSVYDQLHEHDNDTRPGPVAAPKAARAGAGVTTRSILPRRESELPQPVQRLATAQEAAGTRDGSFSLVAGLDWDRDVVNVQAKADADLDPATVQRHAAAGVAGTGSRLPHLDQIQRSFGEHDVSGIRAHVGGAAASASAAIGAEAYATDDAVAFRSSPDLHTAAHEAAHVIQQRGGVQLKGGVGQADDPYERHADAVADAVVRGESAAHLLATGRLGGTPAAVQKKDRAGFRPEDEDEGRGIAKLRAHQPSASHDDPGFAPLPAWAGMTVQEFTTGNLLSHVQATPSGGIKARSMIELSRGWKERLEAGSSTMSVTAGNLVAEVKAGYKNVVARGANTYYADLSWRIAILELNPDDGSVVTEQARIEEGGRIVFTTATPVDLAAGPSARRPDALAIDPATGTDHSTGRVTCEAGGEPDDQCFMSPDERARTRVATTQKINAAQQNFIRACDQRKAAIKAAQAADEAFVFGLAEIALGFGLTAMVKVGAKVLAGRVAGKAPELTDVSAEGLMDWADRAGAHDHMKTAGPGAIGRAADLALDLTDAKNLLIEAMKPGADSQIDLLASIKRGADKAFLQVSGTLDARTDDELFAIKQAFAAGSQDAYAAQLEMFLAKYAAQVSTLGEYDAHYAQDFAERVAWMKMPGSGRRGLARIRVEITDRGDGSGPFDAKPPRFLGWVDDEMIPFALDRHQRIFGAVETLGAVP